MSSFSFQKRLQSHPLTFNQSSSSLSSSSAMTQPFPYEVLKGKNRSNRPRPISLPEMLSPKSQQQLVQSNDHNTHETGLTPSLKLLQKFIQEHNLPAGTQEDDDVDAARLKRQHALRILSIIDDIRSRLDPNTHPSSVHRPLPLSPRAADDSHRLRRELSASMTARKSLEKMFSSLGREKEFIASELARKVHEMNCMEEVLADMREENKMLTEKVQACVANHRRNDCTEEEKAAEIEERNIELSEKLLMLLDSYRTTKRQLRDAREEIARLRERKGGEPLLKEEMNVLAK